ncbi:MAG: NADPH-dependent 7-cyano-7-deazaguanine reductase [Elusimicrobia bacterium ADurb.Bin231]|nr:MAG: NADPH-dependent 7-cyano-7-deazaguanine reductase [Elusimicrobia bacterium ADurb.Bin231]
MKIKTCEVDSKILVVMPYEYKGKDTDVIIETEEFTCLCPWSGQPDYAHVKISYIPAKLCVELKSLKLYLQSYRNTGIVHESVVNRILNDLVKKLSPKRMSVEAIFNLRGGIKTTVKTQYEKAN